MLWEKVCRKNGRDPLSDIGFSLSVSLNIRERSNNYFLIPWQALRVLAEMPNTSQDDVDTLLVTLLDDKKVVDKSFGTFWDQSKNAGWDTLW